MDIPFDPDLPLVPPSAELFLSDQPLLDVRAEVEFTEGAFPSAYNSPLLDNEQRRTVGKTYKHQGQDAAIRLGLKLVSGLIKETRMDNWVDFINRYPGGSLYCFRGGMRSKIVQQWIFERTGVRYPRVQGGYKAMRRFLTEQLELNSSSLQPVVLGGRTGCGKTRLLQHFTPNLDLEKLAWHRGSAFGSHASPQPTQIDFENALSIAVLRLINNQNHLFLTEDESRNIGRRHMPMCFFSSLENAPVVVLEASAEERVNVTFDEYIVVGLKEYESVFGEELGFVNWADSLRDSLYRIRKRLGGVQYDAIRESLEQALSIHQANGDQELHRDWIKKLLEGYYDSMYSYQLDKKRERIVFSGSRGEVMEFLNNQFDFQKNSI